MRFLRAVYIIWYRDILRFWREKIRLIGAFGMPLLFLVVFGSGLSRSMGMLAPGVDFTKFMFPGIVSMVVIMQSLMSGMSVVWDREFGFLKEVLVAPVSRTAVAAGKVFGGSTIGTVQGILILVFAPLAGVSLSPLLILKLIPVLFVTGCAVAGVGILIATRLRSMEAFQMVMNILMLPMIFLSGVFFPLGNLPTWMTVLVKLNPVTYAVASIRELMLPGMPPGSFSATLFGHTMSVGEDVAVVAAFGLIMVVLAMWSFQKQD